MIQILFLKGMSGESFELIKITLLSGMDIDVVIYSQRMLIAIRQEFWI